MAKLIFGKQNEDSTLSFAVASIVKLFSVRLSRVVKGNTISHLQLTSLAQNPVIP